MNLLKREPVKYVPKCDRDLPRASEQTVFTLRPLTQADYFQYLQSSIVSLHDGYLTLYELAVPVVRLRATDSVP